MDAQCIKILRPLQNAFTRRGSSTGRRRWESKRHTATKPGSHAGCWCRAFTVA